MDRDAGDAVVRALHASRHGDASAAGELLAMLYDELRDLAGRFMARERADHTLQPTALVHEAWMRLVGQRQVDPGDRREFMMAASHAMRRVLVDHARRRRAEKRGGDGARVALTTDRAAGGSEVDLVALDEALTELESMDEFASRIVVLRFFAGLTVEETAASLDCSSATVKREWETARAWLFRELANDEGGARGSGR